MVRRLSSVAVAHSDASKRSSLLPDAFHRNASTEGRRLVRSLSLVVLIGTIVKAIFWGKKISTTSFSSIQRKGSLMSATAMATDSDNTKTSKRELLDTLANQNKTVEVSTDDTLAHDMEPDKFREAFERKVSRLSGFSARPLRRSTAK
jgi:hypothetical protein